MIVKYNNPYLKRDEKELELIRSVSRDDESTAKPIHRHEYSDEENARRRKIYGLEKASTVGDLTPSDADMRRADNMFKGVATKMIHGADLAGAALGQAVSDYQTANPIKNYFTKPEEVDSYEALKRASTVSNPLIRQSYGKAVDMDSQEYKDFVSKLENSDSVKNYMPDYMTYGVEERTPEQIARENYMRAIYEYNKGVDYTNKSMTGLSPKGQFAMQTATSLTENLARLPVGLALGNPASLAVMGTQVAGDEIFEANTNGIAADEALGTGIVKAAIEIVTEYLPTEHLLSFIKEGGKSFLKAVGKTALEEGAEEAESYVLGYLFDKEMGKEVDFSLQEMGKQAAMGALTGGLLGAAGTGINRAFYNNDMDRLGDTTLENNMVEDLIETGIESAPETESYQRAEQMFNKYNEADGDVSQLDKRELGELYAANVQAINEEEKAERARAFEKYNTPIKMTGEDAEVNEAIIAENNKLTEEKIKTLGKQGAESFRKNYNPEYDFKQFEKGFNNYYEAGLRGLEFNQVHTAYDKVMNEGARFSALAAGKEDALSKYNKDVANQKTFKVKGTSVKNVYPKKTPIETVRMLDNFTRVTGVPIKVEKTLYGGKANGYYRNGVVYLAEDATIKDGQEALYAYSKHEITHALQDIAPEEYKTYSDYVLNLATRNEGISGDSLIKQYIDNAKKLNVDLTVNDAVDEITADFTIELFKNPDKLSEFIEDNITNKQGRTVIERLKEVFHKFIQKLKSLITGAKDVEDVQLAEELGLTVKEFEKAEQLFENALKSANKKTTDEKATTETQEDSKGKNSLKKDEDSEGNTLTTQQIEFFKDSKVRDESGNLQVVYHGSETAGFSVFNRTDDIGYFFTSNRKMAKTYTTSNEKATITELNSWGDAIKAADFYGYDISKKGDSYVVKFSDGYVGKYTASELPVMQDDLVEEMRIAKKEEIKKRYPDFKTWNDLIENKDKYAYRIYPSKTGYYINFHGKLKEKHFEMNEFDEALDYLLDNFGLAFGKGIYAAYLNIKNPLVIDGNGSNWNEVYNREPDMVTWNDLSEEVQNKYLKEYDEDVRVNSFTYTYPRFKPDGSRLSPMKTTREWVRVAVEKGYDGVVFKNIYDNAAVGGAPDKYESGDVYVAFNSNQIKSVDNKKPTDNPDIRFSLKKDTDSEGKKLTPEQIEFFKNSMVVDPEGRLKVLYHGSDAGGFTKFEVSDDIGYFFSDERDTSESYLNHGEDDEPMFFEFKTWDDALKMAEWFDFELYENEEGNYVFNDGFYDEVVYKPDELREFTDDFESSAYEIDSKRPGIYEVYLNLKNPLIINGNNSVWNAVYNYESGMVTWNELTDEIKEQYIEEYGDSVEFIGYDEDEKQLPVYMPDGSGYSEVMKTRDWVRTAKDEGFDGVIFKDIWDLGSGKTGGFSNVYVALDSNQIKSINNENPTSDDDIRYSLKKDSDSENRKLTTEQFNRFKNSKAVDENGRLLVMFHGTPTAGFTMFDKNHSDPTGNMGAGFYFTNIKSDADINYASEISRDLQKRIRKYAEKLVKEKGMKEKTAFEKARKKYVKDFGLYEVYLNIVNPVVVDSKNSTKLFSNLVDDKEARKAVSKAVRIAKEKVKSVYDLPDVLWNAYKKDGITLKDLKAEINDLYLENENGEIISNEVTRAIVESLGYDGIIDRTVYNKWGAGSGNLNHMKMPENTVHIIAFKPSQIKNVDNKKPTDDPDIRFSLKKPVEETKDLVAIHNASIPKLMEAIKLGGLPGPSVAITKKDMLHDSFGDVSLILPKSSIDPEKDKRNRIYGGDAWTPTKITPEYNVDQKAFDKFNNEIAKLTPGWETVAYSPSVKNNSLFERNYKDNDRARTAFLILKGKIKGAVMKEETANTSVDNKIIKALAKSFTINQIDAIRTSEKAQKEFMGRILQIMNANSPDVKFESKFLNTVRMHSIFDDVFRVKRNKGKVLQVVDEKATRERNKKKFTQKLEKEYEEWIKANADKAIVGKGIRNKKDKYTPSGRERKFKALHDEYNLDNIVAKMFARDLRDFSVPEYSSVEEVKEKSNRLTKDLNKQLDEISLKMAISTPKSPIVISMIQTSKILKNALELNDKNAIEEYLKEELGKVEWADYKAELLNDILELHELWQYKDDITQIPTKYFEAKPQRVVGFDEPVLAVIPEGKAGVKELKAALDNLGVKTIYYNENVKGDRLAKINENAKDVMFSLKDNNLLKENIKLKKENEYLKSQFELTDKPTVNEKELEKVVKNLIRDYSSESDYDEIYAQIKGLYNSIQADELTYYEAQTIAYKIGKQIVDDALATNDYDYQQYKGLRDELRQTKIRLSESDKASLPDGYSDYRKSHFGSFILSDSGTYIDKVYNSLAERYPEFFDAEQYVNGADQIQNIADVLYDLKPFEENPFEGKLREATSWVASDILEQYFDVPQNKPTFADRKKKEYEKKTAERLRNRNARYEEKLAKLEAEKDFKYDFETSRLKHEAEKREARLKAEKEKVKQTLKEVREKRDEKIRKMIDSNKNMSDKRKKSVYVKKIKKHIEGMNKLLLKPTNKSHVPELLQAPVSEFLKTIDLENDRLKAKSRERLMDLQNFYQQIIEGKHDTDFTPEIDPDLMSNMTDAISDLKNLSADGNSVKLADLNKEQAINLYKIVLAVEKNIRMANKAFFKGQFVELSDLAQDVILENSTDKTYTESINTAKQWMANLVNVEMVAPEDFMRQLGPTMYSLYKELRLGLDKQTNLNAIAKDYYNKLTDGIDLSKWTDETAETVKFTFADGRTVEFTPAQLMSLYLLAKQPAAKAHMFGGGIVPTSVLLREKNGQNVKNGEEKNKVKGRKRRIPEGEPIVLNEQVLKQLTDMVEKNKDMKKVADGISKFFADYTSEWGNETSLQLYGYRKFTEENYFPIVSDRKYLMDEFEERGEASLANLGAAKARVKGANNPIYLEDIFDVFTRQVNQMANYNAYLIPINNIQKVYNWKRNKDTLSVKQAIAKKFGDRAVKYIKNFMVDVNGGGQNRQGARLDKVISNYKQAKMGLNLRVALQQPTAYLRASAILDPKYLLGAFGVKTDIETIYKYAPIARWKNWGFFSLDTGKDLHDIILNKREMSDYTMWLAGKMDDLTWQRLWAACELEIADKYPDIRKGSEEFLQMVGTRLSEVVDRTQVVDSTFHRPQILRSKDGLVKMSASFMSEPMKSYNLLRTALREAQINKTQAAKKAAEMAVMGYISSVILNDMVTALIDTFRGDDDDEYITHRLYNMLKRVFKGETIDEQEKEKLSPMERWLYNFTDALVNEPAAMFPYIKDLASMIQGFSVKRMDMAGFADIINAARRMFSDNVTAPAKIAEFSAKVADVFGVPVSSVKRDTMAIVKTLLKATDSPKIDYEITKIFKSVKSSSNKRTYLDILYRALEQDDKETYNAIVKDLQNNGYKPSEIQSGMQSRWKKNHNDLSALPSKLELSTGIRPSREEETKPKGFSVNDLSADQFESYREKNGKYTDTILKQYQALGINNVDDETYNDLMGDAKTYSEEIALAQASGGRYEVETGWVLDAYNNHDRLGLTVGEYLWIGNEYSMTYLKNKDAFTAADEGIDLELYCRVREETKDFNAKDENGETVTGLKKRRIIDYLNDQDITKEEYDFFFHEVFNYK